MFNMFLLTLAVWGSLANCLTVGNNGADIEEVNSNSTIEFGEELIKRLEDLETKMEALEDENKYLKTKTFKTCHELKNSPYNATGFYWLDPDGSGIPVKLFCDMDKGFTEVGHNHETVQEVIWCKGEGCYNLQLEYTVSDDKIEAIIAMSDHCEQDLLFQCKMAPLKNTAFGKFYYGWWVDRHGNKQFYFDGDNEDDHVCGCHNDDSCSLSSFNSSCHCDTSLMPLWNSDSGKITNKNALPVRQFQYGAFFSEHQAAKITVGKLRCSGKPKPIAELSSTCSSLKKGGLSVDGYYLVKDNPTDSIKTSFCALSKSGFSEQDLRIESQETFSSKTIFNVTSFKCNSCSCSRDRYSTGCSTYNWLSDLEVAEDKFPGFVVDKEEGSVLIQNDGLYIIFLENEYFQMYIGEVYKERVADKRSIQWIEKNEKIKFKIIHSYMHNAFGGFAIQKIST